MQQNAAKLMELARNEPMLIQLGGVLLMQLLEHGWRPEITLWRCVSA